MSKTTDVKRLALIIAVISLLNTWSGSPNETILRVPLEWKNTASHPVYYECPTKVIELTLEGNPDVLTELREGLVRTWIDVGYLPGNNSLKVEASCPDGVKVLKVEPSCVILRVVDTAH